MKNLIKYKCNNSVHQKPHFLKARKVRKKNEHFRKKHFVKLAHGTGRPAGGSEGLDPKVAGKITKGAHSIALDAVSIRKMLLIFYSEYSLRYRSSKVENLKFIRHENILKSIQK